MSLWSQLLPLGFRAHDRIVEVLGANITIVKHTLLWCARLAVVFGWFFPMIRKDFGSLAAYILLGIVFLSPIAKITRMRLALLSMGLRRELGILMGCLALVHGLGYMLDPQTAEVLFSSLLSGDFLGVDVRFQFGLVALFFTLPLLATSNTFATKILGNVRWKQLHTLVYPLFVLVILHWFLRSWMPIEQQVGNLVQAVLVVGFYTILKYMVWKPESISSLRIPIQYIAQSYAEFRKKQVSVFPQPSETTHS